MCDSHIEGCWLSHPLHRNDSAAGYNANANSFLEAIGSKRSQNCGTSSMGKPENSSLRWDTLTPGSMDELCAPHQLPSFRPCYLPHNCWKYQSLRGKGCKPRGSVTHSWPHGTVPCAFFWHLWNFLRAVVLSSQELPSASRCSPQTHLQVTRLI